MIHILNNRHRGISRNLLASVILLTAYKGVYDFIIAFGLTPYHIIGYLLGNIALFSVAPLLYIYFRSLLTKTFVFQRSNIKHFSIPFLFFIISTFSVIFSSEQDIISVLNHRFEKGVNFERSFTLIMVYLIGYPLLVVQWAVYVAYTFKLIRKQKKKYGKFYGSFEKRNEVLIKRLHMYLAGIFVISFIITFLQISNEKVIIALNSVVAVLITLAVYYGQEQVNMKKYRMYKLSSHKEDIDNDEEL